MGRRLIRPIDCRYTFDRPFQLTLSPTLSQGRGITRQRKMTLTELRYVVALAQERHFGRAAQKCFVTQPTLSLALAKLEDELGVKLFERNKNEVLVTARGQEIVEQARRVLDEVDKIQA